MLDSKDLQLGRVRALGGEAEQRHVECLRMPSEVELPDRFEGNLRLASAQAATTAFLRRLRPCDLALLVADWQGRLGVGLAGDARVALPNIH